MICERSETCPFFPKIIQGDADKELEKMYRGNFCYGLFTRCARYVVIKVCGKVPDDLYPNMHDMATKLCGEYTRNNK